jgi:hypothetical protein
MEEELQLKFTSGLTDIVIGNTDLAFGTTMPSVVHDWSYQEFQEPIVITLPITEHGRKSYDTVSDEKEDTHCFTKWTTSSHWYETQEECSGRM